MKIQTLADIKKALAKMPEEVLENYGVGYNQEGDMDVQLLCWGGDDEVDTMQMYEKDAKKYPQLESINDWIEKIAEMGVKQDSQSDELNDLEQTEPMFVE